MITTGAVTHRIDRLEQRGLVVGARKDDRRKVLVRLTSAGLELVDDVVQAHMDIERSILADLSAAQRRELADAVRIVLLTLGDEA